MIRLQPDQNLELGGECSGGLHAGLRGKHAVLLFGACHVGTWGYAGVRLELNPTGLCLHAEQSHRARHMHARLKVTVARLGQKSARCVRALTDGRLADSRPAVRQRWMCSEYVARHGQTGQSTLPCCMETFGRTIATAMLRDRGGSLLP